MEDGYTAARIDDLPAIWDGFGKLVRAGLGLSGFGANVMDVPPDYTTGWHDESGSGQEELYVALRGGGWVLLGNEAAPREAPVSPDEVVAVLPATRRAFRSGPDGCRLLIVGGTPGRAYEPQDWSSVSE